MSLRGRGRELARALHCTMLHSQGGGRVISLSFYGTELKPKVLLELGELANLPMKVIWMVICASPEEVSSNHVLKGKVCLFS